MIEVVYFQRLPGPRAFSIERLFADLRAAMPPDISWRIHVSPLQSRGLFARLANVWMAWRHRGTVNHITGDVHFLAFGLPGAGTVLTVHDCGILVRSSGPKRWLYKKVWFSWPLARCRVVTAVSKATKQDLVELAGAAPEKIRIVHDCVSPEFVANPASFNSAKPVILLIGTAPNKNLERMPAALKGLVCRVELLGRLTERQRSLFGVNRVEVAELGDVDAAAIIAAYRRCDILLFASTHEGFGLPILEAQATGRPVITSNCSSMPEVAGGAAYLADPFDASSIRAGIDRVIHDGPYREQLIQLGYENVRRFSAARIAGQYAEIYREIADPSSPK